MLGFAPEVLGPHATGIPLKAEIQVRTLLEHAFSSLAHDTLYKTELLNLAEADLPAADKVPMVERHWSQPGSEPFAEGRRHLKRASELAPRDAEPLSLLADCALHVGDHHEARRLFAEALAADGAEPITLVRYLEFEAATQGNDHLLSLAGPMLHAALDRAGKQIATRSNLPVADPLGAVPPEIQQYDIDAIMSLPAKLRLAKWCRWRNGRSSARNGWRNAPIAEPGLFSSHHETHETHERTPTPGRRVNSESRLKSQSPSRASPDAREVGFDAFHFVGLVHFVVSPFCVGSSMTVGGGQRVRRRHGQDSAGDSRRGLRRRKHLRGKAGFHSRH